MSAKEQRVSEKQVAVIIVNYNGGELIIKCLDAVFNQSKTPSKIIVVDNNSRDGSRERIETEYPAVVILKQTSNLGFASANNRALEWLRDCRWVALLNPDTIPYSDWLEKLMDAVEIHSEADIFSSKLLVAEDNQILDGTGDVYHVSGLSWRRHHGQKEQDVTSFADPVFSPCAAAALYRLAPLKRVGGFDGRYFCYHEDVDLVFRMRLAGSTCVYVENSVVEHVGSGITGQDSDFSVYHGHRNLVWTYFKNMPGWLFWKYLPQHLLLNIISVFHYAAKGRLILILKSKWHAIKGISLALKQRRSIQKMRSASLASVDQSMAKGFFKPYFYRHK